VRLGTDRNGRHRRRSLLDDESTGRRLDMQFMAAILRTMRAAAAGARTDAGPMSRVSR
jgi:hypothetical protein